MLDRDHLSILSPRSVFHVTLLLVELCSSSGFPGRLGKSKDSREDDMTIEANDRPQPQKLHFFLQTTLFLTDSKYRNNNLSISFQDHEICEKLGDTLSFPIQRSIDSKGRTTYMWRRGINCARANSKTGAIHSPTCQRTCQLMISDAFLTHS